MARAAPPLYQVETSEPPAKALIATNAILIRTTRLTDTSLIVHWLTEDFGILKSVAKGALRPKSSYAGKLDLFFSGHIILKPSKNTELHYLKEVTIEQWREGLRRAYLPTLSAGYFCQLVSAALDLGQIEPSIYHLLGRALGYLEQSTPNRAAVRFFERELSKILGIGDGSTSSIEQLREHIGSIPSARVELMSRLKEA